MGWQDAPVIDAPTKPKWQDAPVVEQAKPLNVYSNISDVFSKRINKSNADAPTKAERALRATGDIMGAPVEAATVAVEGGLNQTGILPLLAKINEKTGISRVGAKIGEKVGAVAQNHPRIATDLISALDIAGGVPAAGIATGAASKVVGGTIKGAGKGLLMAEMKIPAKIARASDARNLFQGKKNIVNAIDKYKLESATGGFEKMVENTQNAINKRMSISDKFMNEGMAKNPNPVISLDANFVRVKEEIMKSSDIPYTLKAKALQKADEFSDAIKIDMGASPDEPLKLTLRDAEIAKKKFYTATNFNKGRAVTADESVDNIINKKIAYKLNDEIGKYIPQHRAANKEISELIPVDDALDAAMTRQANWNTFGLQDIVLGSGAGAAGSAFGGAPGFSAAAVPYAARRILGKGKLASTALQTGRRIEDIGRGAESLTDMILRTK